jgi:dihydrodipicolinate synthase/N-acetylneuraminate lyase
MADRITGIFAPNLVPLHDHGEINEPELRRFVDWLIERGVHGLFVNGSTGEFTRFTAEERRRIAHVVCEQAKGRVPVIAGTGEPNVRETLRACETYLGYGARAVAVVSPFYFKLGQVAIEAYFREIAGHSPIDVLLYNIPAFASPMSLETIRRLSELRRIVGIKESSGDIGFMLRLVAAVRRERPEFSVLTGSEAVLVPMLLFGVDGGTHSIANVVPEVLRHAFDAVRGGKVAEAELVQHGMNVLLDALLEAEFPEGFRMAAALRGFEMGRGRQPLPAIPFDAARVAKLIAALTRGPLCPELLSSPPSPGR